MALFLGILIFAFVITAIAIVPFIDFLYRLRFQHQEKRVPLGGGVLLVAIITFLFGLMLPLLQRMGVPITSGFSLKHELNIIFFTFVSFGVLGLYDDILKIFGFKKTGFFGLRIRHKFLIQFGLALAVAALLYFNLGINYINIPYFKVLKIGWWYIPFAALVITAFNQAFERTNELDGLSCGVLIVCLLAFWGMSFTAFDTILSSFIALWIGALIAFLYFNVYPARVLLGSAGGLAFSATLAVVGLLLGKIVALLVIGGIFVGELIWPIHKHLLAKGWGEPKIVLRAWLAAVMLAIFGLWLAYL